MYVRGPGMKAGGEIDVVTTHTDVASTLLRIAGIKRDGLDGQQMPFSQCEAQAGRSEHTAIEFWGRVSNGHRSVRLSGGYPPTLALC
jgi:arylsulfatase A-like enzyme